MEGMVPPPPSKSPTPEATAMRGGRPSGLEEQLRDIPTPPREPAWERIVGWIVLLIFGVFWVWAS